MSGFFAPSEITAVKQTPTLIPRCGLCGLKNRCRSPKIPLYGRGERKVLIIGEAPGENEDTQNKPFVGKAGRFLRDRLDKIGVDLERDCWVTNSLICRPTSVNDRGQTVNRTPTDKEISGCRPNVIREVQTLKPDVILLLGGSAVKSVVGWLWQEDVGTISRWEGWKIPCQKINSWICPTFHPSFVMREEENAYRGSVVSLFFDRHLKEAFEIEGKPWRKVPNWDSKVRIIKDDRAVAEEIMFLMKDEKPIAFDFETDRLKPDHPEAEIVCCSVANSSEAIAFPWYGEAITATKELLQSDVPKIIQNCKFESRWTRRILKTWVNNVVWDTMLTAHTLDNRKEITSLEFQEFVVLGYSNHKSDIKPYLKSAGQGGNSQNRIREAPLDKLLHYNALDSLIEYKLAKAQAKQMGVEL